MIYRIPTIDEPLDQGDIIDDCPVPAVTHYVAEHPAQSTVGMELHRVIVLTQTCDLANAKVELVSVATVFDAQHLIKQGILKAGDVKGPIRSGRTFGVYFLPAFAEAGIGELIVDFRGLFSIDIGIIAGLAPTGKRRARLLTPYREHLADTYSRIGLPQPYETI